MVKSVVCAGGCRSAGLGCHTLAISGHLYTSSPVTLGHDALSPSASTATFKVHYRRARRGLRWDRSIEAPVRKVQSIAIVMQRPLQTKSYRTPMTYGGVFAGLMRSARFDFYPQRGWYLGLRSVAPAPYDCAATAAYSEPCLRRTRSKLKDKFDNLTHARERGIWSLCCAWNGRRCGSTGISALVEVTAAQSSVPPAQSADYFAE